MQLWSKPVGQMAPVAGTVERQGIPKKGEEFPSLVLGSGPQSWGDGRAGVLSPRGRGACAVWDALKGKGGTGRCIERQRRSWAVCLWCSQLDWCSQDWLKEVPHSASNAEAATEDGDGTAGHAWVLVHQEYNPRQQWVYAHSLHSGVSWHPSAHYPTGTHSTGCVQDRAFLRHSLSCAGWNREDITWRKAGFLITNRSFSHSCWPTKCCG